MKLWLIKIKTYWRLGISNVATVAIYRIVKKSGLFEWLLPIRTFPAGFFFLEKPETIETTYLLRYFSNKDIEVSSLPDWLLNPFNHKRSQNNTLHWSKHPDFNPELGDIKMVWEASRFDWLPKLAWDYKNGNNKALSQIEHWLQNWIKENPVNQGINWKCGQEASFRCLNLMLALVIIDSNFKSPTPTVRFFLYHHLKRISLTLRYAMAQDNNHGTSEASSLFVVGHYLGLYGNERQKIKGEKWAKQGRYWLENRAKRLIMKDGSFSQNSVVYHRLLLDTLSITELFRRKLKAPVVFSDLFYKRAKLAALWLYIMTDKKSGDAPNIGANDGAYLFNLDNSPYRDFRPSIQLSCALFDKSSAYSSTQHPLMKVFSKYLEDRSKQKTKNKKAILFDSGGYLKLSREKNSFAIMRLPIYRFRPSDADALHVDIWHNGLNILRDAGTYSYNTSEQYLNYFPGTQSHNTIVFDKHDQMPRLGRFLFGDWLQSKASFLDKKNKNAISTYTDSWNVNHKRFIQATTQGWIIEDEFFGFEKSALLHWNLPEGIWKIEHGWCIGKQAKIRVVSDKKELLMTLKNRFESLFYSTKKTLPLLEVDCSHTRSIKTEIILFS